MSVKRIDRTPQLMADLEKSATSGVKEAALMLKAIAREMVSRRYTKTGKQAVFDRGKKVWDAATIAAERARARQGFLNRKRVTSGV